MSDDTLSMSAEEGQPLDPSEFRAVGEILARDAAQIMERWFERASRQQVHASRYQREVVMDDLLDMLHSLAGRLQRPPTDGLEEAARIAAAHGEQRAQIGWNIVDLVRDYEILHIAVLEHVGEVAREKLTHRHAIALATLIESAIGSAVDSFSRLAQERLRAELRQLTLALSDAEHHERQRIAQQLHDDLQQLLVAMQVKLQTALAGSSPDRSAVEQAITLAQQTIEVARHVTSDLYPKELETQNLPVAIEQLAETFEHRYHLSVAVHLQVDRESNPGGMRLRRLLYDAVRELLFNVVKHAQTDEAWVTIAADDRSPWSIEVGDRGVGTADVSSAESGIGMASVRQRIEQVGGTMAFHSKPGEGTRVILTVPVESTA